MKKIMTIISAAGMLLFNACASYSSAKTSEKADNTSVLVAYFSARGHTQALAEKVADLNHTTLQEKR